MWSSEERRDRTVRSPDVYDGTTQKVGKRAGPVVEWLSSHAPLGGPGFCRVGSWAQTWHHSSGHVEAASHVPQLEGPTTKIYNYVLGGFGEKKQKEKK